MFFNKNAGDPTKWNYDPDLNRPARNDSQGQLNPTIRLTMQLSSRDKLNLFADAGASDSVTARKSVS